MHSSMIHLASAFSMFVAPILAAPAISITPGWGISNTTEFQEAEWAAIARYMEENTEAINHKRDVFYEKGKLPGCETDPTWSKQKSGWKHGDGKYIIWDCKSGYHKEDQCYSMYFAGKKETIHENWESTGSSVDCRTTSSCANQHAKMENNCDTNTWNIGYGAGVTFADALSLDFKFEHGGSKQTCKMEQTSSTCTWDPEEDEKNGSNRCHAIWKASTKTRVSGYMSRVCRFTKTGVPHFTEPEQKQAEANKKFDSEFPFVVGMMDWDITLPDTEPIIGCAAKCGDKVYPASKEEEEQRATRVENL